MLVSKQFRFEAAHHLINYHGKCENPHGHSYKLVVTIKGDVDEKTGMVMDFLEIKKIVKTNVLLKLDHKDLNDVIENSSAELIAEWIWQQLKDLLPLHEVKLWETENSWVTYNGK